MASAETKKVDNWRSLFGLGQNKKKPTAGQDAKASGCQDAGLKESQSTNEVTGNDELSQENIKNLISQAQKSELGSEVREADDPNLQSWAKQSKATEKSGVPA